MTATSFLIIVVALVLALGLLGVVACLRSSQCSRLLDQAAAQRAEPQPEQQLRRSA